MSETKRLYLGVGISSYGDAAFADLPKAVDDIESLGAYLHRHRGYRKESIPNPTEDEARAALKHHLKKDALPPGSALVLLWSGHGEMAPEALHLIARDTEQGAAPDLTPESLASFIARCGATQALLLLDTCYSGSGVFDAQRVVDLVKRERADDRPWFGVLASASDFERARDGVFVARLLRLLKDGPSNPAQRTRWSAHNEGVRGDDVMDSLGKEWDIPGQKPKSASTNVANAWPMFPNPRFNPDAPERVVEHLLLAAEGRAPDEDGVYFTGRTAQLDALVQWIHAGEPGVFVVKGPAGSGKSAIAGRIVSLSNPAQRARLAAAGPLGSADPGEGTVDAHVHARRLTVDQVVEAIDRQLVRHGVLPSLPGGGERNRGELLGGLERIIHRPLIVLDGLDEAGEEVWAIADDVVGLLAGSARVLIATRPLPSRAQGKPDLLQALAPQRIIDLGDPDLSDSTQHDVAAYVRKRLAGCDPEHMEATKVAEAILRSSNRAEEGAFLLAQVVTSQLRTAPIDTSLPGWEGALSRSIEEAFARDLDRVDDPARVRELLAALAWAYGSGLPDDLWPLVATALSTTGGNFTREDVHSVLGSAGRYIVEDGDGTRAVYRLSHQRLANQLHPPAKAVELDAYHAQAARVANALVVRYRDLLTTGLQPKDRPYLWRYTWRHCADGGPAGIAALRELVEVDRDAFLPDLASALNNLGNRYSEVGRRQEALAPTEEAVRLRRALAQDNPAFLPDLAMALNNLGICYSELGRRQEALAPTEEAAETYRALAQDNPAFLPDLASALNNLGNRYSELGRRQEALAPTEEAVRLRRALAQDNPAFLPDLASALNNLGNRYSELGRRQEALAPTEEAVRLRRALAQDNPAFLPDLATSIGAISYVLAELDRHLEAAQAAHEALAILAPFVERYPETYGGLARRVRADVLRYSEAAAQAPNEALLKRVAGALGGGESGAEDTAVEALRAKIGAILLAAENAGVLDEAALAELPATIADQLRAAWAGRSG